MSTFSNFCLRITTLIVPVARNLAILNYRPARPASPEEEDEEDDDEEEEEEKEEPPAPP